jgi:peptidoglycan/xylan/chitin deacetylase (PgdA/CDA1 family)
LPELDAIVLNFHCIGRPDRTMAPGEADVAVDRRQFAEILDAITGRDDVLLTFDDGNRSDVTEALPELLRRGLRAQFFICAGRFGMPEFVSEHEVRELRDAGMCIGSHGLDHLPWRRLEPSGIQREIVDAKRILEDSLQESVSSAACPYGAYDRRTLRALRDAGFARAYTSDGGKAKANEWLVPRNTVCRWDSTESVTRVLEGPSARAALVRSAKTWIKQRR